MHDEEVKHALTKPKDYFGSLNDWIDAGYGATIWKNRDSDALELSNYDAARKIYESQGFEYGRDFVTDGANHWAVGWVESIVVRVLDCKCDDDVIQDRQVEHVDGIWQYWHCLQCKSFCTVSAIFKEALEIRNRLEDYPVLDEMDLCEREWNEMADYCEQEVGDEYGAELHKYLNDCSYSRPDEVPYMEVEKWKELNIPDAHSDDN
jgi:hypothetical protein